MSEIILKVYEPDMKTVKKEYSAQMTEVPFGAVRRLMRLFDIDKQDNADAFKTITAAWDSVIAVLDNFFPEMTEADWDYVSTRELVGVVIQLVRSTVMTLSNIPKDPKN
jgi:hypothetical protein